RGCRSAARDGRRIRRPDYRHRPETGRGIARKSDEDSDLRSPSCCRICGGGVAAVAVGLGHSRTRRGRMCIGLDAAAARGRRKPVMILSGALLVLFGHFLVLSLLSIGGAITVAPDMHRVMVDQMGLLSDAQFNASIAIAQASPGPNVLFVAVMGYQAAGLAGVAATLFGIMLPSTTLALAAARWGHARREWRAVQAF